MDRRVINLNAFGEEVLPKESERKFEKTKENTEAVQDSYDKSTDFALVFEKACKGIKSLNSTICFA